MRAGNPHSFSFSFILYILSLFLSIFVHSVFALPADSQSSSSALQQPSQSLGLRSDLGSPAQSSSSSHSSTSTTASSTTTSTTAAQQPTTSSTTHHHHQPTPSPTSSTSITPSSASTEVSSTTSLATSNPLTTSSSSSSLPSSSLSGSGSITLIPALQQTTLSVAPTNFPAPTTLVASSLNPDATSNAGIPSGTSPPGQSNVSTGSGLSSSSRALIGVFSGLGAVFVIGVIVFITNHMKKSKSNVQFSEEDQYVINDRFGRTGFTNVNYGDNSANEMAERPYSDRSFLASDVEHTLGQEIIQQPPFDPFHNNFAFLDNQHPSDPRNGPQPQDPYITADQMGYQHDGVDAQAYNGVISQSTPWANQVNQVVTTEPAFPFRYEQHPYASDAVHVTPLRRQPSERAEYGLAC